MLCYTGTNKQRHKQDYYDDNKLQDPRSLVPEAACSVAQHLGGVEVELAVVMVIGGGVPVGVGYDDAVGQDGQGVLDDRHLQSVA